MNERTNMKKLLTAIYFSGFYETWHAQVFDDILDQECEYLRESYEASDDQIDALNDAVYMHGSYSSMYLDYAKIYAKKYNQFFAETCNIDLGLDFESMSSPKEYNFSTDRIFCHIPLDKLKAVYTNIQDDILQSVLSDTFTSYDGFISFYSNVLDDWKEKPLEEYDHNEIQTLLDAYLVQRLMAGDSTLTYDKACQKMKESLEAHSLMESEMCNGVFDNIFWDHAGKEAHSIADSIREREQTC